MNCESPPRPLAPSALILLQDFVRDVRVGMDALDVVQPPETDPTQSMKVVMSQGPALPPGAISGTIKAPADAMGDAYVIAFSALNPPPPVGTGRPVALGSVPKASFMSTGSGIASLTVTETSFVFTSLG